ncbi:FAD-binding domain-containing protein [Boletus edulis BED1]|uniref:FAD-binding domain-containing protein n=1 Tax=Boletus edulis BED1 TaxID=1328754 RepID=A0AAD4GC66_BOLED|nr:FAD-binding domain-containing protein [Boletus edulis BED1]
MRFQGVPKLFLSAIFARSAFSTQRVDARASNIWDTLNSTVEGRLRASVPFARPCFTLASVDVGSFNPIECTNITQNYLDHFTRSRTFGAYMNTQWETCQQRSTQCLLDDTLPNNTAAYNPPQSCAQGSIPNYYVEVAKVSDVQAAVVFAKNNSIPLVIKNTGHDYIGRSSGPSGLAVWMRNYQNISLVRDFVPTGCSRETVDKAVTFGAGANFDVLYQFADANNITLPGAEDLTVGAGGGYLMGGGHSALSPVYGLAVDRVLEYEVVVASGQVLVANRCQNSDLFFALRGGGGGTFGVVTQVTTLALPQVSLSTVVVGYQSTPEKERAFVEFLVEHAMEYANQGWGGYATPQTGLILTTPLLNITAAEAAMASLQNFTINTLGGFFTLNSYPSYLSFFQTSLAPYPVPVGLPFIFASRLVPAANFETRKSRSLLVEAMIPSFETASLPIILIVAPYLYNYQGGTSVTDAWRSSLWHVAIADFWNYNTTYGQREQIYASATRSMAPLRALTPKSGAYQNEADVYEPNHTESFWGSHYEDLVRIKRKYDPEHLFDCWHCVDWTGRQNPRYQCYMPRPGY